MQIGGMCYQACNSTGSPPWLGASACAFGPDLLIEFLWVGPFPASLPTVRAYIIIIIQTYKVMMMHDNVRRVA
jgi:hypothetical protein